MRRRVPSAGRYLRPAVFTSFAAVLTAIGAAGCTGDTPALQAITGSNAAVQSAADGPPPIIVGTAADLVSALSPANAGRRIVLRAGTYHLDQTLSVPDGATLEGEGVMQLDEAGRPTGFAPETRTSLTITANVPGNVLTLGNGASVSRLAIDDLPGRSGNAIGVASRQAGDRVSASITEVEIVNQIIHGVAPQGPTGCGIAVLSLNRNTGADPEPHADAAVTARVVRTLVRSPAVGTGCGIFAFNFAPSADVTVWLTDNVIGGGLIASGGVSRPDAVHDARTTLVSRNNVYRDDTGNACVARRIGWNLQGGAGTPVPLPNPGVQRNALRVHSVDDRVEGFLTGVLATGGRRFFPAPTAGAASHNTVDLELIGTTFATSTCGGAGADLRLAGALVGNATIVPGNGNTLRAVMRGVTGSGRRANIFADVLGPAGAQPTALQGAGNRLTIVGSQAAFHRTTTGVAPAPSPHFFTGGGM